MEDRRVITSGVSRRDSTARQKLPRSRNPRFSQTLAQISSVQTLGQNSGARDLPRLPLKLPVTRPNQVDDGASPASVVASLRLSRRASPTGSAARSSLRGSRSRGAHSLLHRALKNPMALFVSRNLQYGPWLCLPTASSPACFHSRHPGRRGRQGLLAPHRPRATKVCAVKAPVMPGSWSAGSRHRCRQDGRYRSGSHARPS